MVSLRFIMVRYQGIRPAEKYMVATVKRYQNLRAQSFSWVNMKPRKEEPISVPIVPSTVLATEMMADWPRPVMWVMSVKFLKWMPMG